MTAPIEPVHVMSREKYDALQVKWLEEQIHREMMSMLLSNEKISYGQSCNVQFTPFFSFSIPVERNLAEEYKLHKHGVRKGEKNAAPT